jgi:hypothetical protein
MRLPLFLFIVLLTLMISCAEEKEDVDLEELYKDEGVFKDDSSIYDSTPVEDIEVASLGEPEEIIEKETEILNKEEPLQEDIPIILDNEEKVEDNYDSSIESEKNDLEEKISERIGLIYSIDHYNPSTGRRKGKIRDTETLSLFDYDTYEKIVLGKRYYFEVNEGNYGRILRSIETVKKEEKVEDKKEVSGVLGLIKKVRRVAGGTWEGKLIDKKTWKEYTFESDEIYYVSEEVYFEEVGLNAKILNRKD